jgi:hypothetical protein
MWLVIEQYFCTSYSFAVAMIASGFSWPSTTLVCSAEYTSAKLIEAGAASKRLEHRGPQRRDRHADLEALQSSGRVIGLFDEVIWRKPLSQILSITTRLAFAICART